MRSSGSLDPYSDVELSDEALARRLADGEALALNLLMQRHKEPLLRFILRYVLDVEEARDLLQESFIRLYQRISQFSGASSFKTWLYSIALNLCRDRARYHKRRATHRHDSLDADLSRQEALADLAPLADEALAQKRQFSMLENAIGELPHDLKAALILHTLEGYSQSEAATLLGITPKAVETRVYRAKKILRKQLSLPGEG